MGIRKGAGYLRLLILMPMLVDITALAKPALLPYRPVPVEFPVDLHRIADGNAAFALDGQRPIILSVVHTADYKIDTALAAARRRDRREPVPNDAGNFISGV